ncbi:DNA adenine methylase [Paracoccus aestuariivivens]|uniref:DNA adenine methylase n=2 Tax=Paracoccus aestuariivivens TaxID=1820333 RepID=A0A6L6J2I7_9RHOB|nr:DNA adenine methylase [Paracoccus aestuariivivens]MTH76343.1 DNA adenine methylase [Paracoccus aestuariivivens]
MIPRSTRRSSSNPVSPFRYPGGKAFLSEYLESMLPRSATDLPMFAEPFCGGAGAALTLLADGHVSDLFLNDADARIHSTWFAMLHETDRFIAAIHSTPLDIAQWYRHRDITESSNNSSYSFDVGFSTFFMNRTTRSGIIEKSGPIGGYEQNGKWKLSARFNRDGLAQRVRWLSDHRSQIHLHNLDALNFIHKLKSELNLNSTLFFIDPPYVQAGGRLYYNGMSEAKHVALSDLLTGGYIPHWILTYDDAPLIRKLYQHEDISLMEVNYSLQRKRIAKEILVTPPLRRVAAHF